jgi:hypothetical protein
LTACHKLLILAVAIGWPLANVARFAAWLGLDGGHTR